MGELLRRVRREAEGVHQVAGDVYLLLRVLERLRPVGGARAGGGGRAERLSGGGLGVQVVSRTIWCIDLVRIFNSFAQLLAILKRLKD